MEKPKQIGGQIEKTDMGKEKGQRGGKTNVRHTLYIRGLRQTAGIMVSYRKQQFSLQIVQYLQQFFNSQRSRIQFQQRPCFFGGKNHD